MTRIIEVGAAQFGPTSKMRKQKKELFDRLIAQLVSGPDKRCDLVIFLRLDLATFLPCLVFKDIRKIGIWFEESVPDSTTNILFQPAKKYEIGFRNWLGRKKLTNFLVVQF